MKTYRQQLRDWLNEEKYSIDNKNIIDFIDKLQNQIKSMEPIEESMVNGSYIKGFYDAENKRGYNGSYYRTTYKQHDFLKSMLSNKNY